MVSIPDAVRAFFAARRIAGPGVVAVSGGPDSVALLRALVEVGGPLTVAHVNHQLRGTESDADEEFVRNLAATLGVGFRCARLAVPPNENLEAAARRLRYEFLHSVAVDMNANWIATGHTADDQAETVLHRLIRGAGIQGLRGIATVRHEPRPALSPPPLRGRVRVGGTLPADAENHPHSTLSPTPHSNPPPQGGREPEVVRPLLHVTRADILNYLAALNLPARTDSSNADPRFTRNRIRHDLLPRLMEFNPEMVAVLGRLAEQAEETFTHLEGEAAQLLAQAERPPAGDTLVLDRPTLDAAPPLLVRELFRILWRREGWPLDAMTFAHWQRAAAFQPADFPGGVALRTVGRVVQLRRNK